MVVRTQSSPRDLLSSYLLPYQRKWLADASQRVIILKSRQIGATWVGIALRALLEALEWRHDVYVMSYRLDSAKEILTDISVWCDIFTAADAPINAEVTATRITLPNGSRIIALPASPEAVRGKRGSVYVDEAAVLPHDEALWQAVSPVIASNSRYRITLVSTPLGARGLFHRVWTEGGDRWSRHRVDIYDAVADGLDRDVESLLADSTAPEVEFLCSFDVGGTYLSLDRLLSLQLEDLDNKLPPHGLFIGIDLGKVADFTAIVLLRVFDDAARPPEVLETRLVKSMDYHAQRQLITSLITDLDPRRVVLDATAHAPLVDEVRAALPQDMRSRVSGHHATHPWKKAAVEGLRDRIESKDSSSSIRFSFDKTSQWDASTGRWCDHGSRVLLDDLARVEQTTTPSGRITYEVKRRAGQGHGDAFSALLLALEAAQRPIGGHPFKVKRKDSRSRVWRPSLTF